MRKAIKEFWKGRIARNAAWMIAGKLLHILLSFFVGLLTARYLGPSNYGLIGYAGTYTTFFAIICNLGINSVILKNFVDHPEEEGETLGTTLMLRLISSLLSIAVITQISFLVDHGDPLTVAVVCFYAMGLVFQIFDTFHQWFQSRLQSKYYAIATLAAYIVVSAYKLFLLIRGYDVRWFAVSNSVDYFVVAAFLYLFYRRNRGPRLSFSWRKARELLSVSVSYILSGLMASVYAVTDKFMLKQMIGDAEAGYYTLAANISLMWVFVLSALIESTSPAVMEYYRTDRTKFEQSCKRIYAIVFYVSVLACGVIALIAVPFVRIVYGEAYLPAVIPLRIVVWYAAFSYLGVARNVWVVCEKQQKHLKYIYLGSALLNVILNALLIPVIGASGAALASSVTQFASIFLFPLRIKAFRPNLRLMADAILLKGLLPKKER